MASLPGGSDDVEAMLIFLRSTGRLRATKIDRMEQAYREEQGHQKISRSWRGQGW